MLRQVAEVTRIRGFSEYLQTFAELDTGQHHDQNSYRSGKTGKVKKFVWSGKVREGSKKNIILEKSGKMILDHADCRYL